MHFKPGKGNLEKKLSFESVGSISLSLSERPRARTLSINGEPVRGVNLNTTKVDLSCVNIHDFAVFEKEKDLLPEFRESIKSKKLEETVVGHSREINGKSENSPTESFTAKVKRNTSFQEVAKKVRQLEKVLIKWPRRSRQRHHSSSSEDFISDSDNEGSPQQGVLIKSGSSQRKKRGSKRKKSSTIPSETNNNEGAVVNFSLDSEKVAVDMNSVVGSNIGDSGSKVDAIKSLGDAVISSKEETGDLKDVNVVLDGDPSIGVVHVDGSPSVSVFHDPNLTPVLSEQKPQQQQQFNVHAMEQGTSECRDNNQTEKGLRETVSASGKSVAGPSLSSSSPPSSSSSGCCKRCVVL